MLDSLLKEYADFLTKKHPVDKLALPPIANEDIIIHNELGEPEWKYPHIERFDEWEPKLPFPQFEEPLDDFLGKIRKQPWGQTSEAGDPIVEDPEV